MASLKLYPYRIRIKNNSTNSYVNLNNVPTSKGNKNFSDIFKDFCNYYTKIPHIDSDAKKTMIVENVTSLNNSLYQGILKSGEHGYRADFYNINTKIRTKNARKEEHSEELPFYFLIKTNLNQNKDLGILILQTFKNFGVKSIFHNCIYTYIKKLNQDLTIMINPILSEELLKKLEKADRIIALRFIKREVPKDCAEKVLLDKHNEIYEERVFKLKRGKKGKLSSLKFIKNRLNDVLNELKNVQYPYMEVDGETYDEIKIEISKKNSKSTLKLNEHSEFREYYVVNERNITFVGGHPTEKSMSLQGVDYLNTILENHDEDSISLGKE